jgi:hypothetical protein
MSRDLLKMAHMEVYSNVDKEVIIHQFYALHGFTRHTDPLNTNIYILYTLRR